MITAKRTSIRSMEENRYYWGVVIHDIALFKNWTPEQAHIWVKITWNVESTTTMTTQEYEALLECVRQHCLKFWNLKIKLPNAYD